MCTVGRLLWDNSSSLAWSLSYTSFVWMIFNWGGSVSRYNQSLFVSLLLSNVLCSHVLLVKLALSPEQRLSETTCFSVSGDYLLCPRCCQIIKHLHPHSYSSLSPRGSLLLRLDVWLYKAAFLMSRCDSPLRVSLTTRTAGQYFNSKLLSTSNLFQKDLTPSALHLHNIDDHRSGSDTVNNEKWGFCRQMGWDMKEDRSAGIGFLSEWLLINGADEGHISSLAQDRAQLFSDHNHPHAAGLVLTLLESCAFFQFKKIMSVRLLGNPSHSFFSCCIYWPHTHCRKREIENLKQ